MQGEEGGVGNREGLERRRVGKERAEEGYIRENRREDRRGGGGGGGMQGREGREHFNDDPTKCRETKRISTLLQAS